MPILKPETDLSPGNLLDELAGTDPDRRWWAVYTKSRQEKALARQLGSLEVPFYLPLVPQTSYVAGRRTKSLLPLFSSYMFVYASDEERISTLSTDRVSQMVCAKDTAEMTKDLTQIRSLISSGKPMTIESRLEPGRQVRVKNGPLLGLEGVVVARRNGDRLLVAVKFLQQGVSVEINDYQLEPL